jgi:hypothetical protein
LHRSFGWVVKTAVQAKLVADGPSQALVNVVALLPVMSALAIMTPTAVANSW